MKRHSDIRLAVSLLFVIGWASLACPMQAEDTDHGLSISIRVYNYAQVPESTLRRAKNHAGSIFHWTGFTAEWFDCRLSASEPPKDAACADPLAPTDVVLKLLPKSMSRQFNAPRGTLGFALPAQTRGFGTAHVFVERAEELVRQRGSMAAGSRSFRARVVGLGVAHEIGHLLMGSGSHSKKGLMKLLWNKKDLQLAALGGLVFVPEHARQAQAAIAARVSVARGHGASQRADALNDLVAADRLTDYDARILPPRR